MNILDDLDDLARRQGAADFDVAVMLTFTSNLRFFEELVLPRLERVGASRIAILADRGGYDATLENPVVPEHCGRKYAFGFNPGLTSLQHAKILWLHGQSDIVWIGSHNLTAAGYNDQREVSAKLDSAELGHRRALAACHTFVGRLVAEVPDVQAVWSRVAAPMAGNHVPDVEFLHNLDASILDQLRHHVPSGGRLRLVTPFLDLVALERLVAELAPSAVTLDIPHEGLDVPVAPVAQRFPGAVIRQADAKERVHAKAYVVDTAVSTTITLGSANCTNAGLVRSVPAGGNVECVVVIPGGNLGDEVRFTDATSRVDEVPHTGRRWDEPTVVGRCLHIDSAIYTDGRLFLTWHCDAPIESITVSVGDVTATFPPDEREVEVNSPPAASVAISGIIDGASHSTRRWVTFPEHLAEFAGTRGLHRMRQYVAADEPRSWSDGIDYVLRNLARALRRVDEEQDQARVSAGRKRFDAEISEALEILAYSKDRDSIEAGVSKLIIGDHRTDLLAALRGLLRRIITPLQIDDEDPEGASDTQARLAGQQRAANRSVSHAIFHVRLLAASLPMLESAPAESARFFLANSFLAVALLWRQLLRRTATNTERGRFAGEGLRALQALTRSDVTRTMIRHEEVAGPFILALSSLAEAALGEDYARLQAVGRAALDENPKDEFAHWQAANPDIVTVLSEGSGLDSWWSAALALMGMPSAHVQVRQDAKWGCFFDLVRADASGDPDSGRLFQEAELAYKDEAIWTYYKRLRNRARVIDSREAVCMHCRQRLPRAKERTFRKGDPVDCWCGTILVFRE